MLAFRTQRGLTDKKRSGAGRSPAGLQGDADCRRNRKNCGKDSCAESVSGKSPTVRRIWRRFRCWKEADIRREIEPIILEERKIEHTKLIYHKIRKPTASVIFACCSISARPGRAVCPCRHFEGGDPDWWMRRIILSGAVYTDRPSRPEESCRLRIFIRMSQIRPNAKLRLKSKEKHSMRI